LVRIQLQPDPRPEAVGDSGPPRPAITWTGEVGGKPVTLFHEPMSFGKRLEVFFLAQIPGSKINSSEAQPQTKIGGLARYKGWRLIKTGASASLRVRCAGPGDRWDQNTATQKEPRSANLTSVATCFATQGA